MVLNQGLICDIYGVDFNTGKTTLRIEDLCIDVPGNVYKYAGSILGGGMASVGVWDKGKQFIYSLLGTTSGDTSSGRSLYMGIDMDSKKVLWRVFNQPPQDKADKDWALHECDIGFLLTTPCSKFVADPRNRSLMEYDWQATPGEPPSMFNGVSGSWGQPVIEEDLGVFYIQSGNQSPYTNLTTRPGPNLYGTTIMAIDMKKGQRNWWVQTYPHDPYDKDCNWSGMLIDHPQLGKIYVKGCKDGYMYVLNAETGKPLKRWNTTEETYGDRGRSYIIYDPPTEDMLKLPWAGAGKAEVKPWARINSTTVILSPGINDFAGDAAYDGQNTLYYKPVQGCTKQRVMGPAGIGVGNFGWSPCGQANTTLVARDLVTGQIKWKWGPVTGDHRVLSSHIVITGGVAIVPRVDGYIYFLDKDTGQLLSKINMGAQMLTGPSVGQDSDGRTVISVIVGLVGGQWGPMIPIGAQTPGAVVTIGLSEKATEVKTTTVTSTSATTVTTTAPGQTVTTTSTAESIGPITYAAIGIAVIAIAAAAVLVMRKK